MSFKIIFLAFTLCLMRIDIARAKGQDVGERSGLSGDPPEDHLEDITDLKNTILLLLDDETDGADSPIMVQIILDDETEDDREGHRAEGKFTVPAFIYAYLNVPFQN